MERKRGYDDATVVDIEINPQRHRIGRRESDFSRKRRRKNSPCMVEVLTTQGEKNCSRCCIRVLILRCAAIREGASRSCGS